MTRDKRLRDGLVNALIAATTTVPANGAISTKTGGEILERWDALIDKERLLSEHHAVGALDDALIGDDCPVCAGAK